MSDIVVGVDGSEGSLRALRFAIDEARVRGCGVRAVIAWRIPAIAYEAGWAPIPIDAGNYEAMAEASLDKVLEAVEAGEVEVTRVVREGQAADVLLAEARTADLLVVGSRGLGGFRGLLLGSVSAQCAHHAPCPVAIVPPAE
jgi:nucleotide-binding universal stress UspA family protein